MNSYKPVTMRNLTLALLFCALLSLSNAQCFFKHIKAGQTHCQDDVDKTWHAVGSSWRNSQCMDCNCNSCCTGYATPQRFPADCVSVFVLKECKYNVHKRDDPSVECPVYGAVGK